MEGFIYRVPIIERYVEVDGFGGSRSYRSRFEVMCVDGVGLRVYFTGEKPTPQTVRRHLVGVQSRDILIHAESATKAVLKFYDEWDGANVGGRARALLIDESKPIWEYPPCSLLQLSRLGSLICGRETGNDCGEHGGCVLDNFDPPYFHCPIHAWRQEAGRLEGFDRAIPVGIDDLRYVPYSACEFTKDGHLEATHA